MLESFHALWAAQVQLVTPLVRVTPLILLTQPTLQLEPVDRPALPPALARTSAYEL